MNSTSRSQSPESLDHSKKHSGHPAAGSAAEKGEATGAAAEEAMRVDSSTSATSKAKGRAPAKKAAVKPINKKEPGFGNLTTEDIDKLTFAHYNQASLKLADTQYLIKLEKEKRLTENEKRLTVDRRDQSAQLNQSLFDKEIEASTQRRLMCEQKERLFGIELQVLAQRIKEHELAMERISREEQLIKTRNEYKMGARERSMQRQGLGNPTQG